MLDLDAHLDQPVTPVGFIALLLVVMFVLFYNQLKQSILFYYQARMRRFETRLNAFYPSAEQTFALTLAWPVWQRGVHDRLALLTYGIFSIILLGFTTVMMVLPGFRPWDMFSF